MAVLLPPRGDDESRLVCSHCRKICGDDMARAWLFERYGDAAGEQVTAADQFEVRRMGAIVKWRAYVPVAGRPPSQWVKFRDGTILCADIECSPPRIGNFRVFDPATGVEVGP